VSQHVVREDNDIPCLSKEEVASTSFCTASRRRIDGGGLESTLKWCAVTSTSVCSFM
jgi:hypothetical protein